MKHDRHHHRRGSLPGVLAFALPALCLAETALVAVVEPATDWTGLTALVGVIFTGVAGLMAAYAKLTEQAQARAQSADQLAAAIARIAALQATVDDLHRRFDQGAATVATTARGVDSDRARATVDSDRARLDSDRAQGDHDRTKAP